MRLLGRVTATGLALAAGIVVSVVVPAASWARTDVHDMGHASDALLEAGEGSVQVGGVVWDDYDHDGIRDADEPGLPGVSVGLVDNLGQPVTDLRGNLVHSYPTGGDGVYLFEELPPGTYAVQFVPQPGFLATPARVGSDTSVDSDGPLAAPTVLAANQADLTIGAGFYLPVSLGDLVWIDADGDGVQDDGEAPLAGVTATLYTGAGSPATDVAGAPVPPQISDGTGRYRFVDLNPGTYRVVFSALPAGYLPAVDRAGGNFTRDSDGLVTAPRTLKSGEVDLSIDLGLNAV